MNGLPCVEAARTANPEMSQRFSQSRRRRTLFCHVDNILVAIHPRCTKCTVLLGPGHDDPASDDGLCGQCRPGAAAL